MDKLVQVRTGAIRYIPVNYHLAANTDGTGRMRIVNVYTNLCAINKLLKHMRFNFILEILISSITLLYTMTQVVPLDQPGVIVWQIIIEMLSILFVQE